MADTDRARSGTGRTPRRTQAQRRAASERKLLDATARLIAERGTSSVSFSDIAREAGCSHGLPGYLFGSKTNLLLTLVDDVLHVFRTRALGPALRDGGQQDGLDAILRVLEVFLSSLDDPWPQTRAIYVLIGESFGAPPELRRALAGYHRTARTLLRDMLAAGVERGEIRPDIDVEAQAAALMGLLRGVGSQVILDPEAVDVSALTAEILASTRRSLAAQSSPRPPSTAST